MDLSVYTPTVSVDGEIIAEPTRTTVTKTFYSRVAIKLAPFVLLGLWLFYAGTGLLLNVLTIVALLFVVSIVFPKLGSLLSVGGGALKMVGALFSGVSDMLDGIVGPNKGQVPVLLVHVQSTAADGPATEPVALQCSNPACGHRGTSTSAFCLACGSALPDAPADVRSGPRRHVIRIQGQIVGGEPRVGHQVSVKAFDHRGTLLFVSGIDRTTGAEIIVKRDADTGAQH